MDFCSFPYPYCFLRMNKMRLSVFFVSWFTVFISCNSKAQRLSKVSYTITSDTVLLLKKDALGLFDYSKTHPVNNLYLYQRKYNELVRIDLTKGVEDKRIKLEWQKKDSFEIGALESFYFHNNDSIILLYEYRICIIDSLSNLKFQKIINDPGSEEWPPIIYTNLRQVFPIHFDDIKKKILLRQHCGSCEERDSFYYSTKIAAFYNFQTDSFEAVNISFPESYKVNFYGDADLPFREVVNGSLIFVFATDPNIYTYELASGKIDKIWAKSSYQSSHVVPLAKKYSQDINKRLEHLIESPLYLKILFDRHRNLFYRFFLREQKIKDEKGGFNKFGDKELVVMVMDRSFTTLLEINLGSNYLWHYSFVTPAGLYILKDKQFGSTNLFNNEAQNIQFDIIRIDN